MYTNASRPNRKAGDEHLVGKRAKWVSVEEMRAWRRERRYFQCGRSGCHVKKCPLLPPINPDNEGDQWRLALVNVLKRVEEAYMEDSEESNDKPKE